jgi:hypothetical protein
VIKLTSEQLKCACIIGDVISSKKIGSKAEELDEISEKINKELNNHILTPFTQRIGDEIFGIVNTYSKAYYVLKQLYLLSKEYSVPLYVGVGFGAVEDKDVTNPHKVNGSAVWSASESLSSIKKDNSENKAFKNLSKDFKFFFKASNLEFPYLNINYQTYFIFEKIMKRTDLQQRACIKKEQDPKITLETLGTALGYEGENKAKYAWRLLNRAEFDLVYETEKSFSEFLDYLQKMHK